MTCSPKGCSSVLRPAWQYRQDDLENHTWKGPFPIPTFFFLSRIDRSLILLISRTQPQAPMQHLWAQSPLAPQVDSWLKPSCTQSSGADPPCCRNHEPRHCSQASRKKPVSWVNGLLVYQNSNFVLLLSSNHLKHISPLKREKLERSKETALPSWTAASEQTQGSTHIAAGFPAEGTGW